MKSIKDRKDQARRGGPKGMKSPGSLEFKGKYDNFELAQIGTRKLIGNQCSCCAD